MQAEMCVAHHQIQMLREQDHISEDFAQCAQLALSPVRETWLTEASRVVLQALCLDCLVA